MNRDTLLEKLVSEYFSTRPNLGVHNNKLAIFFFSCSGAGKSTVRRFLVDRLKATYVCNDEVRELLARYPEASKMEIDMKLVVDLALERMHHTSDNHLVIYDNVIVNFYQNKEGYLRKAKDNGTPIFIIGIDVKEDELRRRIKSRNLNVEQILSILPDQIEAYKKAVNDIAPDWVLAQDFTDKDLEEVARHLKKSYL